MSSDPSMAERRSIIDSLGVEIVGVMSPVSICMLLVVLLISFLSHPASSPIAPPPVTAANLVYQESPSDSTAEKLGGSLLNAAAFVVLVAGATFLLVLLYYYNFTSCLRNYMRFSAFFVLSSMGGSILLSILTTSHIPLDAPTAFILLFNFSLIGVLSVFSNAVPILLRQAYTVALGVIVAAWFTQLPEWTTWSLLVALAIYDLVAVLAPRGPLRMLVELSSSRDDDLPALVYEARPTVSPCRPVPFPLPTFASPSSVELQPLQSNPNPNSNFAQSVIEIEEEPAPSEFNVADQQRMEESAPLVANVAGRQRSEESAASVANVAARQRSSEPVEEESFETTRGIRLGLGDFVFYSVLVGRAAMYDLMTVYACYLAIVAGLGCTLILLSVRRQALPALPISIALGMGFYFLTRLLMEPFIVGASTSLVMF